jgi:hypothetical protein
LVSCVSGASPAPSSWQASSADVRVAFAHDDSQKSMRADAPPKTITSNTAVYRATTPLSDYTTRYGNVHYSDGWMHRSED